MLVLKLVMPLMLDAMANVSVAEDDWLAANGALSRFQVKVIGPFAVVGFQFVSDMFSVNGVVPTFLI